MSTKTNRIYRFVTALVEREGRYLITQRCTPEALVGLWEFPGCKVEPGSSDALALQHELRERLGIDVVVGRLRARRTHHHAGYSVDVALYETSIRPGQVPRPLTVADFCWVGAAELEKFPFPAADQNTTDLLLGIKRDHPQRPSPWSSVEASSRTQRTDAGRS